MKNSPRLQLHTTVAALVDGEIWTWRIVNLIKEAKKMKLGSSVFLFLLSCSACVIQLEPNDFSDCIVSEQLSLEFDLRQATRIKLEAGAGSLIIQPGATDSTVSINGTACARSHEDLQKIKLRSNIIGGELIITAEAPVSGKFDLIVSVPDSLPIDVSDSSGDVLVEDLVNDVYIRQGSGNLNIREITGSIRLNDGSGNIGVRGISGDVVIDRDGSGNIGIERVGGSVIVHEDGSGNIDVRQVQGDFILERDGSGSVFFSDVAGRIVLP